MKEIKEKPKPGTGNRPKTKVVLEPRQIARLLKDKYLQQLDQRPEGQETETGQAVDQIAGSGEFAADELTAYARTRFSQHRENRIKERTRARQNGTVQHPGQTKGHRIDPENLKEKGWPQKNHVGRDSGKCRMEKRRQLTQYRRYTLAEAPEESRQLRERMKRGNFSAKNYSQKEQRTGATMPKGRSTVYSKTPPVSKISSAPQKAAAFPRSGQTARQRMTRQAAVQTKKAVKKAAAGFKRMVQDAVKAAAALTGSAAGLVGGGILLVVMVVIIVIAAVANSPFGLFFAAERNAPDTVSVSEAVAQVNMAYNARLEDLQAGGYDSIEISGQAADWPDVLAVFAVRYAGAENGVDVATLDADRVEKLTAVFWDMTEITSWVETIDHPGSDDEAGWTEYILHITITPKTADDMRTAYLFTRYQNSALDELLADRAALSSLAGSLTVTNADAWGVLECLPDDLSPERRGVVETAMKLYGKVNYFYGGKSLVLGWDNRWGQLRKVTAEGSPTTGTYRPYGLDCSGYVDWVFYNTSRGQYIIGHGGGAHAQHTYCTDISWNVAQPGDLVFYPDDEHVGIVCGRDENGELLIIHCASGANNVVITGKSGFTSVARPLFYDE